VRKGRVVVDIRGLNKITIKDAYPLPNMSDIIAAVSECPYITVVDALAFFHQFPLAEADRHKFTIVSHRGTERYRVAMMGFKNSPHAQRYMDQITREMKHFLRVYIDDFIVYSKTLQEHREHLKQFMGVVLKPQYHAQTIQVLPGIPVNHLARTEGISIWPRNSGGQACGSHPNTVPRNVEGPRALPGNNVLATALHQGLRHASRGENPRDSRPPQSPKAIKDPPPARPTQSRSHPS